MRLRDRPTPDLIVVFLTGLVALLLVGSMVSVVVLELSNRGDDVPALAGKLADVTNTLIGAVVGYLAGRGTDQGDQGGPE